jgi:hypothetical protein
MIKGVENSAHLDYYGNTFQENISKLVTYSEHCACFESD